MHSRDCCRNLGAGPAGDGTSCTAGRRARSPPLPWQSWTGCAALWFPTGTAYIAERIRVSPSKILGCVLLQCYYKYINKRYWKACRFSSFFWDFPFFSFFENSREISCVQGYCYLPSSWPSPPFPIQTCTKKPPEKVFWGWTLNHMWKQKVEFGVFFEKKKNKQPCCIVKVILYRIRFANPEKHCAVKGKLSPCRKGEAAPISCSGAELGTFSQVTSFHPLRQVSSLAVHCPTLPEDRRRKKRLFRY